MMQTDSAVFADHASQHRVAIVENSQIAEATFRLRFRCPAIAERVTPGQFLMLRLANWSDPLIGRPLAMYDTHTGKDNRPEFVDVVYLVGGKMTQRLAQFQVGEEIDLWGPLGNGFPAQLTDHLIMVAGGIGQTPFLALAKEHLGVQAFGLAPRQVPSVKRVTLCYGARSKNLLAGVADFQAAGVEVQISTDDGSAGQPGLVTDLLETILDQDAAEQPETKSRIVCCGPEPMMQAVAGIAARRNVPAQVSLETPMACGIGICFTCVAQIKDDQGESDYRRTCVEGPVFDADRIEWD